MSVFYQCQNNLVQLSELWGLILTAAVRGQKASGRHTAVRAQLHPQLVSSGVDGAGKMTATELSQQGGGVTAAIIHLHTHTHTGMCEWFPSLTIRAELKDQIGEVERITAQV